ncbi:MAG TPA: hypothetical protein DCS12_05000 [Clostridiales bacterium]|jgi:hypothetical protein|nr:hypothetical protein [Clostridiales bacterium]
MSSLFEESKDILKVARMLNSSKYIDNPASMEDAVKIVTSARTDMLLKEIIDRLDSIQKSLSQ